MYMYGMVKYLLFEFIEVFLMLGLFPRAEILGGRGISDGSTFYVVLGNTIKFYCYCRCVHYIA